MRSLAALFSPWAIAMRRWQKAERFQIYSIFTISNGVASMGYVQPFFDGTAVSSSVPYHKTIVKML
jgi:hypothetical protein